MPRRSRTFCDSSSWTIDSCRRCSIDETRSRSASRSTPPSACRPITWLRASSASSPPVAIIALEGMQSHRWAAPAIDVALDERHLGAQRGRDRRAGVAGGAAAEDREPYSGDARHAPRLRHASSLGGPCRSCGGTSLSGRWVLLAPGRAARPHTFGSPEPDPRGPEDVPVLPRQRAPDAARGVPNGRRRARHSGLARARRAEPLSRSSAAPTPGRARPARTRSSCSPPRTTHSFARARRRAGRSRCSPCSEIGPVTTSPPGARSCRSSSTTVEPRAPRSSIRTRRSWRSISCRRPSRRPSNASSAAGHDLVVADLDARRR